MRWLVLAFVLFIVISPVLALTVEPSTVSASLNADLNGSGTFSVQTAFSTQCTFSNRNQQVLVTFEPTSLSSFLGTKEISFSFKLTSVNQLPYDDFIQVNCIEGGRTANQFVKFVAQSISETSNGTGQIGEQKFFNDFSDPLPRLYPNENLQYIIAVATAGIYWKFLNL